MNVTGLPFLLLVVVLALKPPCASAQELIGTAGRTDSLADVQVSFSIGEPISQTIGNGDVSVTQGFLQPRYQLVPIEEELEASSLLSMYPNPTSDITQLSLTDGSMREFRVLLFNLQGKLLQRYTFQGKGSVSLATWSEGLYLIQVDIPSTQQLFSYKLIKSN